MSPFPDAANFQTVDIPVQCHIKYGVWELSSILSFHLTCKLVTRKRNPTLHLFFIRCVKFRAAERLRSPGAPNRLSLNPRLLSRRTKHTGTVGAFFFLVPNQQPTEIERRENLNYSNSWTVVRYFVSVVSVCFSSSYLTACQVVNPNKFDAIWQFRLHCTVLTERWLATNEKEQWQMFPKRSDTMRYEELVVHILENLEINQVGTVDVGR